MSKLKVYREHGYFFDAATGEQYLWKQIDKDKLTFCYKLRRFAKRFVRECQRTAVKAAIYMDYTYHGETPPLNAEEMHRLHVKPDDKVIVWGDCRG